MMLEKYSVLRQDFLSIAEPLIDSVALDELKLNYMHDIDSKRKLSRIKNLETLIRLLEKRDVISYDNIEPLWYISKIYVGKPDLESKLHDYENWLETTPLLPLYNMYQNDEASVSSVSESAYNSIYNLSRSSIPSSTKSSGNITQTLHCCFNQKARNNVDDVRKKLLQQTVLLQIKDRLGRSWRDVARHLGIRECDIDAIQNKHPYDLKEQSYEALKIYMSQSDTEQWALNLTRALEKGRRRDLKELVEEVILKNKNI